MKKIEISGILLICLLVPAIIYLEFSMFKTDCSEFGIVEISQELILLISIWFLFSIQKKTDKIIVKLFSYFLMILFIRELDFVFDLISHGFWFWIVLPIVIYSGYRFYKSRKQFISEFYKLGKSAYLNILIIGLSMLLIFSRLIGTSSLWKVILDENYNRIVKTVVQEGVELFGYLLILLSIVLIQMEARKFKLYEESSI